MIARTFITICSTFLFACSNNTTNKNAQQQVQAPETIAQAVPERNDTTAWIESFKAFRTALYQGNKKEIKTFFSFPVMNRNNEIWYLVQGDEKALENLSEEIKPFTEKDFDKYYPLLFPKEFVTTLLKIKSDSLFKTGEAASPVRKEGNTSYQLTATHNRDDKTLSLHLYSETSFDNEGEEEKAEASVMYYFNIIDNKRIEFKEVRIAG